MITINQVQIKKSPIVVLNIGDEIEVSFKTLDKEGEEIGIETKKIRIKKFKPFNDSSGDIWIIGNDNEIYAEENFVKIITQ